MTEEGFVITVMLVAGILAIVSLLFALRRPRRVRVMKEEDGPAPIIESIRCEGIDFDLPPAREPSGEDEVDPVAEAEVYLAYGREGQAEEILREAIAKKPDNDRYRQHATDS